jgi:hypothetical protein
MTRDYTYRDTQICNTTTDKDPLPAGLQRMYMFTPKIHNLALTNINRISVVKSLIINKVICEWAARKSAVYIIFRLCGSSIYQRILTNLQRIFSNWRDVSPNLRDISLNLRDISLNLRDVSPNLRDVSPNLRDDSLNLRDASPNLRDVSLNLRDASLNLQRVPPNLLRAPPKWWQAWKTLSAQLKQ